MAAIVPSVIGIGSFLGAFLRGQSRVAQAQVIVLKFYGENLIILKIFNLDCKINCCVRGSNQ